MSLFVPDRLVVVAQSGASASHTGNTNETTLATVAFPGLGPNDALFVWTLWSAGANNANAKTPRIRMGGIGGTSYTPPALTSQLTVSDLRIIRAANSLTVQKANASNVTAFGATTGSIQAGSSDLSAGSTLFFTVQLGSAADTVTLEAYTVWVVRG